MDLRVRFPRLLAAALAAAALATAVPAHAFDQELKALAGRLTVKLTKVNKTTLAVVDLVNLEGSTTLIGRFLAEELANDLDNPDKGFTIVDRTHVRSLVKEAKLSSNGLIDQLTSTKLGKMSGASAILTGSVTEFGDSLRITVKVLDTASGKQIASESTEIAKTKALEELYNKPLPEDATPAAKDPMQKASTTGKPASKPEAGEEESTEPERVYEADGVRLELLGCSRGGLSVVCRLTAQSVSKDANFYLDKRTRILDNQSSEFSVTEGKVANESRNREHGEGCSSFIAKTLAKGVLTPVTVSFNNVDSNPKLISSLDLFFSVADACSNRRTANFRDIELSASSATRVAGKGGPKGATQGGNSSSGSSDGDETIMGRAMGEVKDGVGDAIHSVFDRFRPKTPPAPKPPNR